MSFIQQLDEQIILFASEHLQRDWLDGIMIAISATGNKGMIFILLAVIMLLMGNKTVANWRLRGLKLALCLAGTALVVNVLLKPWVARIRPFDLLELALLIPPPHDFSFPSGHTAAAFATATVFFTFGRRWGIAMLCFALLMAFSRLYLLVHFPSDIIIGALLGIVVSSFILWLWNVKFSRKS